MALVLNFMKTNNLNQNCGSELNEEQANANVKVSSLSGNYFCFSVTAFKVEKDKTIA